MIYSKTYIDQYFSFTFSFCNKINNKINKSFVFLITDIIVSTGNVRNSARHTNEKYIKVSVSIIVIIYSSFVSSCCFANVLLESLFVMYNIYSVTACIRARFKESREGQAQGSNVHHYRSIDLKNQTLDKNLIFTCNFYSINNFVFSIFLTSI